MTIQERIDAAVKNVASYREKVDAILAFHEVGVPAVILLDAIRDLSGVHLKHRNT